MRIAMTMLAFAAPLWPALAGQDFGTRDEARVLAERLVAIIEAEGIQAAVEALYDPAQPFVGARMGVNLFQGSTVIADNREPETVAADYSAIADLTGEPVWPRVSDAADRGGDDAVLKWYHYDTQEVYDFHCYAMRAVRDDGHVMVCR